MSNLRPFHCKKSICPERPSLVALHGFLGSSADWDELGELLADRCSLFSIDLFSPRNFSEKELDAVNFNDLAHRLAMMIEGLPRPCILLGYSLGGRIALYTALTYPGHIDALVLESALPGIEWNDDREARLQKDRELAFKIRGDGLEAFLNSWYRMPLFASIAKDQELLDKTIEARLRYNDEERAARVLENLSPGIMPNLWPRLMSFASPTLLISGQQDSKYEEIAVKCAEEFVNAQHFSVANAGHNVHLEQPKKYAKLLSKFLSQIENQWNAA